MVIDNDSFDTSSIVLSNVEIPTLPNKICFELLNVFTPDECQRLIEWSESKGYIPAKVNIGGGREVMMKDFRNSLRCIIDDFDVAKIIFERVKPYLPEKLGIEKNFNVSSVNERLRFLKYDVGNEFQPHYDGVYIRDDKSEISFLTIQIYLNEGFGGGSTRMYNRSMDQYYDVVPKTGSVVIFEHQILHEGCAITKGRKYTIRSDIMYRK